MGVFDFMSANKRFQKRLSNPKNREVLYNMIENMDAYRYNQSLIKNEVMMSKERAFTRLLIENSKWNSGIPEELEWFFKNTYPSLIAYQNQGVAITSFWNKVTPKTIKVHSGLPSLISQTMVRLIVAPGYVIEDLNSEDGNSEDLDRLITILKDNKFNDRVFPRSVNYESYGGYTSFKLSQDDDVSKYPIVEAIQPERFELIEQRGRIVGFRFKKVYEESGKTYELHEVYELDTIREEIYELTVDGKELRSALEPETWNGMSSIPAVYKANTAINTQFKNSLYGMSDYNNSQSLFQQLDENISQLGTSIRFARPKRFISGDLLDENAAGRKQEFDDFETDFDILKNDPDNDTSTMLNNSQFDINGEDYTLVDSTVLQKILNNSGLSPTTIGMTGLEAIDSSDKSQREREKTTLRTREYKLKLWKKALEELFVKILEFDDVVINKIATKEYKFNVTFNDYVIPTIENRIETATAAINGGVEDVKGGIKLYAPDLEEEELNQKVINVKLENGIPLTAEEREGLGIPQQGTE
jgi:hypothetical protein